MQNSAQIGHKSSLDEEYLIHWKLNSIVPSSFIYSLLYLYIPEFIEIAYSLKSKVFWNFNWYSFTYFLLKYTSVKFNLLYQQYLYMSMYLLKLLIFRSTNMLLLLPHYIFQVVILIINPWIMSIATSITSERTL